MYDIIIIGGGPAGMTAALYAQRNGKTALVIEKNAFGGQIVNSPLVENIPGSKSITGSEFAEKFLDQILEQGADIEVDEVKKIEKNNNCFVITTEYSSFESKAVIVAAGVKHRLLGLDGEESLIGEGISFCAICDGDFYKGKEVCVAGGGNSALQEAVLLSEKSAKVTILQDLDYLTGEKKLQDVLAKKNNVECITGVKIKKLRTADGVFSGVTITDSEGSDKDINCSGLFVAIGLIPENDIYKEYALLNNWGYFESDESCTTKTPGLFVAGDCRSKTIRQVTTACSDGATAAIAACRYIDEL